MNEKTIISLNPEIDKIFGRKNKNGNKKSK